jgi:hypothetical protein
LFNSYYCPVQLIAHFTDVSEETGNFFMEEVIWTSDFANSPFGQCPLRFAMEPETHENSSREGLRLKTETEKLKPFHDNQSGKDITFTCLPTEVDGKVKFVWSDTTASMQNCYVCGQKPSELAKKDGNFTPNRNALFYGFSNLHVKMRAFDYICKTGMHRDFKKYKCMAINAEKKIRRKDQLIEDFKEHFHHKIYINQKGASSFINGKVARLAFANPAIFSQITG